MDARHHGGQLFCDELAAKAFNDVVLYSMSVLRAFFSSQRAAGRCQFHGHRHAVHPFADQIGG
jgi:hypothetical protein